MDYLFARINTRKKDNLRQVLSNETTFALPDLTVTHAYDNEMKLPDGEWFCIDQFSTQAYKLNWMLEEPFTAANYAQINTQEYGGIKYIVAYQENDYFLFQRNNYVKAYEGKKMICFHNNTPPKLTDDPQVIFVHECPDAIYKRSDDKLFFKDLVIIKPIFPGIEVLFNEATDEETDSFLQIPLINPVNGFDKEKVKTPNRRRIRHDAEFYNSLDDNEKRDINGYIKEYCSTLNFSEDNGSFDISTDEDLKNLLYGIEQRYYTTRIKPEKRVANSVSPI